MSMSTKLFSGLVIAALTATAASAGGVGPAVIEPEVSNQAAALVGSSWGTGTIIAAAVVGALVVLTIAGDDGTTSTTTTALR